jgi:hypothetical protein
MKAETKSKKLTLKKETLRDLTARNAGEVKGGAKSIPGNTRKCVTGTCTPTVEGCLTWYCNTKKVC